MAIVGTAIVVFSLWPLNVVIARLKRDVGQVIRVRLAASRLEALGDVTRTLHGRRIEIGEINSQRLGKGRYEIELQLQLPATLKPAEIIEVISQVAAVEIIETSGTSD